MQAARRLFDQIKNNRAGRQTGLCFTAVLGLLFLVGSLRYHGDAAGHNSAQQQRKFLDQNKSFCPGPVTEPLKRPDSWWEPFSQKLAAEVAASDALQGSSLVFYGDSITETWRGTDGGHPCSRCTGVPEVFQEYFGSHYATAVLAVGGDQSMHQLWRMHHGEIFQKHQPHIAIVMIGTNDLGAASCLGKGEAPILQAAAGTADRVREVIDFLHQQNPLTHVLILGLLPRGSDPEDLFKLPSDYSRGIDAVNDQLERYAFGNKQLHFADCALSFTSGGKLLQDLMPDALHPNAAGMRLLAECILPFLKLYAPVEKHAGLPDMPH
ncbi:TPA: platelet-activating factor acetyltransferase activity protein [Trebouxia sp. C0005]|nr:MAG: SGNH hydrolase [Trebouxia sp. A1-2]